MTAPAASPAGVRFRVVDAFADEPFTGNPAAVFLLAGPQWPDERWMQRVAMEMSVSESAFALPLSPGGEAEWGLRWFTALVEDEMCGHATLATAHALHQDRGTPAAVRFQTRSGVLTARTDADGDVTLDFPRAQLTPVPVPLGLAEALGAAPERAYRTGDLGDVLTVFSDEATVRGLRPDFAALAERQRATGRLDRGVIATASAPAGSDYDFVSRFFTPAAGVPEDPATGSAHTALAPYWAEQLGRERLVGLQASARTGRIGKRVRRDRIELTGRGVTVSDGRFLHSGLWVMRAVDSLGRAPPPCRGLGRLGRSGSAVSRVPRQPAYADAPVRDRHRRRLLTARRRLRAAGGLRAHAGGAPAARPPAEGLREAGRRLQRLPRRAVDVRRHVVLAPIAGRHRAGGFEHQDGAPERRRLVLDSSRHHENVALLKMDRSFSVRLAQSDVEAAL